MNYEAAEHLLDTYSLTEILELNELTEIDLLLYLVEEEYLELPEILPIDLND